MVWRGSTAGSCFALELGAAPGQPWWSAAALRLTAGAQRVQLAPAGPSEGPAPAKTAEANRLLGEAFAWRAQRLALQRVLLLQPSPFDAPLDQLNPTGFGLATLLLHMGVNAPEDFAALQEDLRAVVPHFERLHVRKTEAPAPGHQGQAQPTTTLDLSFRGAGRVPAERASEGTLFALVLLAALHGPEMPSLLLIDDIDHGLHITAQFQVIKAIRAVMERRPALQVVATSHSPFLFEQVRGAEVRVMALNAEGHACVQPLTAHPEYDRRARSMSTGEVWANVGEAWVTRG